MILEVVFNKNNGGPDVQQARGYLTAAFTNIGQDHGPGAFRDLGSYKQFQFTLPDDYDTAAFARSLGNALQDTNLKATRPTVYTGGITSISVLRK